MKVIIKFLEAFTSRVPYLYVLRFPIIVWLVFVSLPFVALWTPISSVLRNLFDVTERGMFPLTLAAFTTAWTIMITSRLILLYSIERFDLAPSKFFSKLGKLKWSSVLIIFSLFAVPTIWVTFFLSSERIQPHYTARFFYAVLGLLVSLLFLLIANILQRWLIRPEILRDSPQLALPSERELAAGDPVDNRAVSQKELPAEKKHTTKVARRSSVGKRKPRSKWNFLSRLFDRAESLNPFRGFAVRITNLLKNVPENLGAGFLKYNQRHQVVSVLPNHGFAFSLFILSLIFYISIGLLKYKSLGEAPNVPTLAYVLLLLMMLCWGLSGLSFFFDRYRIPISLLFAMWLAFTSFFPSDHVYQVRSLQQNVTPLTPGDIVRQRRPSAIIVVAANGGGIQASGWAARVLTGLVKKCRDEFKTDCQEFSKSIYLISAASGGSVGSMYFVDAYSEAGLPPDADLERVVAMAERSSLDDVAWGLVFPDFQRSLFPFFHYSDRGAALEQALAKDTRLLEEHLSDWREGVRSGLRPATVFNATITETGEPFLLGTTDISANGSKERSFSGKNFGDYYPRMDIPVATAARLSASFPYVSPATRSDDPGPKQNRLHVVDGGYYDNYGMSTLVKWLDQALSAPESEIKHVLVIQIRGAPSASLQDSNLGNSQRWFFQSYAPLATIIQIRDRGQVSHNNIEFDLLTRSLKGEGKAEIEGAFFEYDDPKPPPLSWHLTEKQKVDIEEAWKRNLNGGEWPKVRDFIDKYLRPAQ